MIYIFIKYIYIYHQFYIIHSTTIKTSFCTFNVKLINITQFHMSVMYRDVPLALFTPYPPTTTTITYNIAVPVFTRNPLNAVPECTGNIRSTLDHGYVIVRYIIVYEYGDYVMRPR